MAALKSARSGSNCGMSIDATAPPITIVRTTAAKMIEPRESKRMPGVLTRERLLLSAGRVSASCVSTACPWIDEGVQDVYG